MAVAQEKSPIIIEGFEEVKPDRDGVFRWVYELNLLKNPIVLFTVWKILGLVYLGLFVFAFLISVGNVRFFWEGFAEFIKAFAIVFLVLLGLSIMGYLIYTAIMGGKYCVEFEMDDEGIRHTQITSQYMKAQGISTAEIVMGILAKNPAAVGGGIVVGSRQSISTEWKTVKKVTLLKRYNTIKLKAFLNRNQVYVFDEDYEFVNKYIVAHCNAVYKNGEKK